jgi:hypothetical protein
MLTRVSQGFLQRQLILPFALAYLARWGDIEEQSHGKSIDAVILTIMYMTFPRSTHPPFRATFTVVITFMVQRSVDFINLDSLSCVRPAGRSHCHSGC